MNIKIEHYVNSIFKPYEDAHRVNELKHDLLNDLNERYSDLIHSGLTEEDAMKNTIESIGEIEETLVEMATLSQTLVREVRMDFNASSLSGSDFAGVTLHDGKFKASDLKNADFSHADLRGSTFKVSDLQGANFDGANLTNCSFITLSLKQATFRNAIIEHTSFNKSELQHVVFENIKLINVDFSMTDLSDVNFCNCIIDGGKFLYTDLSGQDFDGQIVQNVHLGKCNLKKVSFRKATLKNVSFKPPFSITNKYYRIIKTIRFDDAYMDKVTYNSLKSIGADLSSVTIIT